MNATQKKLKLLIAGHDLKFIESVIPYLEQYYEIRIDKWTGHNVHNEAYSISCLKWAEIIFCEWLLGNAVWYSQHKKNGQKLIVRMHRVELTTNWIKKINYEKVDAFIAVSVYFFEKLIEYTNIPRSKARLISNFLEVDKYRQSDNPNRVFNLAIIGILPSRKGYLKALEVLHALVEKDKRYQLNVYGKIPEELNWIRNDPSEMQYYSNCKQYIKKHNLLKHVRIKGWVDVKADLCNIGFVLSVSHSEEISESFHIAPADGFAAGGIGLLMNWNGVEYIYPEDYIFNSEQEIVEYILGCKNWEVFIKNRTKGKKLIDERYSIQSFIENLKQLFN
ncbi:glycosyltransferase family protein [Candidatus Venteria ishoeyi]|uniref:Glycosyl transferases group 1 n=1 Tax=Candidatus Venteria ishoeyi TaxID=1899563 RepID=A0A1H6F852_9GAMM|nr:glycosyl transferase family 1 [Candidatus Venteria ishoeyi]SEH06310.1 Uncharacterised protein [Candidatus Venteria ishoeyi]